MDSKQNPPVDPAALAAAAETKVLPRVEIPEGYRILEVGEKIHTGDKFVGIRLEFSQGFDTHCAGETVPNHTDGLYFRRIDPVPHTAPKCDSCGGAGFHSDVGHAPGEECSHCEGSGTDPRAPEGSSQAIITFPSNPPYNIHNQPLSWLYTHCAAIGMKAKADPPSAELDIAMFTDDITAQVSTLTDALTKAQGILTDYLVPDGIEAKEALSRLLVLLESPALVQALKGGQS